MGAREAFREQIGFFVQRARDPAGVEQGLRIAPPAALRGQAEQASPDLGLVGVGGQDVRGAAREGFVGFGIELARRQDHRRGVIEPSVATHRRTDRMGGLRRRCGVQSDCVEGALMEIIERVERGERADNLGVACAHRMGQAHEDRAGLAHVKHAGRRLSARDRGGVGPQGAQISGADPGGAFKHPQTQKGAHARGDLDRMGGTAQHRVGLGVVVGVHRDPHAPGRQRRSGGGAQSDDAVGAHLACAAVQRFERTGNRAKAERAQRFGQFARHAGVAGDEKVCGASHSSPTNPSTCIVSVRLRCHNPISVFGLIRGERARCFQGDDYGPGAFAGR